MGMGALITAASMAMKLAWISEDLCFAAAFKIKAQLKCGVEVLLMALILPYPAERAKRDRARDMKLYLLDSEYIVLYNQY